MQSTVEGAAFVRRLPLSSDESSTPRSRYFHPNLSIAKPLSSTNSTVEKCKRQSRGPSSSDDCLFRRTNHQRPATGFLTPISQLPNSYQALTRRSKNAIDCRGGRLRPTIASFVGRIINAPHPVFSLQSLNYRTLIQH